MRNYPRRLYRARDGKIAGVCLGLARYLGISATVVRVALLIGLVFTGFWPVTILYFVAAALLDYEPVLDPQNSAEAGFYDSFNRSRSVGLSRLKERLDRVSQRISRLEDRVTRPGFGWEERLKR